MTKIAISGAHNVGKSTLIREIVKLRPDIRVSGNLMRQIADEGYGIGVNTTPATLALYLDRQYEQEVQVTGSEHLLSDRILVDGVAYIMAAIQTQQNTFDWRADDLKLLQAVSKLHASRYSYHVLIPIEFPLAPNHIMFNFGETFQHAVQEYLRRLLSEDWPTPVIEVKGSLEERVSRISRLLEV